MNGTELPDELLLEIEIMDELYKNDKSEISEKRRKAVSDVLLEINLPSVDTKQDMQEVYGNIVQSHARFRNECVISQGKLIVLVEHKGLHNLEDVSNWHNKRVDNWKYLNNAHQNGKMLSRKIAKKPPVPSSELAKKMQTMANKYGIDWKFCSKPQTGRRIAEILGSTP